MLCVACKQGLATVPVARELDKLTDVLENIFHVEDCVTGCPLTAGLGGTWTLEVAGRAGAVQVPVIDQEEQEGSAALPSEHASKR